MKLYHFNPNDWGETFYTIAKDKEGALKNLIKYLEGELEEMREKIKKEKYCVFDEEDIAEQFRYIEKWKKVDVTKKRSFPGKFTLNEYEEGHVIESEFS